MAIVTYSRRQVLDMIPELLVRRLATFAPVAKALATDLGVSETALGVLNGAQTIREGDRVTRARYALRSPYAVHRPLVEKGWAELVEAGHAEATADGWRMRPTALAAADESSRRLRAHVRSLPAPAEPTRRAAGALERLADRIPADAPRAAFAARIGIPGEEPPSDLVRLSRAGSILWSFRDDCHVGAWQDAGYEGPAFEVFTFIWSSREDMPFTRQPTVASVEKLAATFAPRQARDDVERSVEALVARGDVVRDGDTVRLTDQGQRSRDAIEAETDRRYFAIWDLEDAATARLGDDLRAIIEALPKG